MVALALVAFVIGMSAGIMVGWWIDASIERDMVKS